jgi:hypothetical protein
MSDEPKFSREVARLLSSQELARVLAILSAQRKNSIDELPPHHRTVVCAIIQDARLRQVTPRGHVDLNNP